MHDRAQDQRHDHDTADQLEWTPDDVAKRGATQQDKPVERGKHLRRMTGADPSATLEIEEEANSERHQEDDRDDPGGMNENELADIASIMRPEQRQLAQSSRCRGKEGRCLVEAAEAGEEGPTGERDEDEERDQRKDRLPPMHHGVGDLGGEGASGHDPDDGSGGIAGSTRQLPVKSSHGDDGSGCQRPKCPRQREAQFPEQESPRASGDKTEDGPGRGAAGKFAQHPWTTAPRLGRLRIVKHP
jgi:hypothetical protein